MSQKSETPPPHHQQLCYMLYFSYACSRIVIRMCTCYNIKYRKFRNINVKSWRKITVEITSWLRLPRCRSVVFQRMRINWRIPLLTVTGPWSCASSLICGYNPVFCLPFENVDGRGGLGGGLVFIKQWVNKKCCKISVKYDARRETNIWKGEQYVTSKNKGFGSAMTHGEYSQQHVLWTHWVLLYSGRWQLWLIAMQCFLACLSLTAGDQPTPQQKSLSPSHLI